MREEENFPKYQLTNDEMVDLVLLKIEFMLLLRIFGLPINNLKYQKKRKIELLSLEFSKKEKNWL